MKCHNILVLTLLSICCMCSSSLPDSRSFESPRFKGDQDLLKCLNGQIVFKKSSGYSASVKIIQRALADLGYLFDTDDGYFGPNTFNAVVKFQTAAKLSGDGKVGADTMAALDKSFKSPVATRPTSASIKTTYYYPPRKDNDVLSLEGYSWWLDLIRLSPPTGVVADIEKRGMHVQNVRDAYGPKLNGDFYAVFISTMPIINGKRATARSLFEVIRKGFTTENLFMDSEISTFSPYESRDETAWNSSPLGSVIRINIKIIPGLAERAGIVTIKYSLTQMRWRVATIRLPLFGGGNHPVSGIREWGMKIQNGGYIFYTRGADRVTGFHQSAVPIIEDEVFNGGHKLWLSMQNRVETFVNERGGRAQRIAPYTTKGSWKQISSFYNI